MQVVIQQKHAGHQAIEELRALDVNYVQLEFSGQSVHPVGGEDA
jgi:hypothetical protein